jgi:hypothetical protein
MDALDRASEDAHKLMLYYESRKNSPGVVSVFESMPKDMQNLPFAWYMYNKHKEPKVWAKMRFVTTRRLAKATSNSGDLLILRVE